MAPIDRLPLEVLGACFAFLPFRDRMTATLVSRTWRASALEAPWLWSEISISSRMKSPLQTLALMLSRTGRRPVVLSACLQRPADFDQDSFTAALNPHMDRVRSMQVKNLSGPFEQPAQALESFTQYASGGCPLSESFLGGELGKLRRLEINPASFPERCPAVSAVTELTLHLIHMTPNGLSDLFALFPRLRSLTLFNLEPGHVLILREFQPPSTLSALQLYTSDVGIDLLDLYNSWSEHLTDVRLVLHHCPAQGSQLTSFLSDALTLIIDLCRAGTARILVLDSRTRKRTLMLLGCGYHALVECLHHAHGRLAHVHTLTISATVLYELCILGPFALPALRHITLALDQEKERCIEPVGERTYLWPWHDLGKLSAFLRSLDVETLTLEMRCLSRRTPPKLEDGRKLLSEYVPSIADPEARAARRLRVRGFPRKVARALSSELRALQLDFDVGVVVHSSPVS